MMTITVPFDAPAEIVITTAYKALFLLPPDKQKHSEYNYINSKMLTAHIRFKYHQKILSMFLNARVINQEKSELIISAGSNALKMEDDGLYLSYAALVVQKTAELLGLE